MSGTYNNAVLTQDVTYIHLAAAMVTARLTPQGGGVRCPRFAHSGDDFLAALQQLADKFKANATARTKDQPGGGFAVCIEDIRDLVHGCCGAGGFAQ